jgi:predicted AAA+ superfamily ATPase
LAGRIRYLELSPFNALEIYKTDNINFTPERLWFRGGGPDSYLAENEDESWNWRPEFIASYVERDIPQFGINVSSIRMRKFWTLLAHFYGQQVNISSIGKSLEVSHTTIRNYLDVLTELFMVRQLQLWSGNTKKRIVKSPKVYVRDSGLLHRLLSISDYDELQGNSIVGHSWEGFVIENILVNLSDKWQTSYYRTTEQTEIDLIVEKGSERWAIEIKKTSAPKIPIGFHKACDDIKATKKFVIYGGKDRYPMSNATEAICLVEFLKLIED